MPSEDKWLKNGHIGGQEGEYEHKKEESSSAWINDWCHKGFQIVWFNRCLSLSMVHPLGWLSYKFFTI